ncbi:MAG: MFS transporter [Lachnospiraceae bacterium]|nr:MFS transporter [Lachnospiraceae bacterium]
MTKSKKIKIIIVIISISFIQGLQYCVSPVLNQIQDRFHNVDISLIQMLITGPALLSIVIALLSGVLVVKISKKKLLIFAGLVAGITGFIPMFIDDFWILFFSRIVYGISLGLATALNTAVVADFFEGDERVSVMGIQAASVGAGMVVVNTVGGILGKTGYINSYKINIIGFISMILIWIFLPDLGKVKVHKSEKIKINKEVIIVSLFGMLEFLFLITFSTNIAMHVSGKLAGNSSVIGSLSGVFSGTQIVIGIILGLITKITKKYTLPVAMLSFSIGGILLILFPDSFIFLSLGAIFCGISQGVFIPTAMVNVSNAVSSVSVAMASAVFTCAMCFGQLISPSVLNFITGCAFNKISTTNVFIISVIGMTISGIICILWKRKSN